MHPPQPRTLHRYPRRRSEQIRASSRAFPGARGRALIRLLFFVGGPLAADRQQHFLLTSSGLAWLFALRWSRSFGLTDAALERIHQIDDVLAARARLGRDGPLCF